MIEVEKDKKSSCWIITKTDSEGFHRQMSLTEWDMIELIHQFKHKHKKHYEDRQANTQEDSEGGPMPTGSR